MERLTIATLNIAAASKDRARRILDEWIARSPFDVYVFTETSEGEGTKLVISEFRSAGWSVFRRPTLPKDRGVVVASRINAAESTRYPASDPAPGRSIVIDLQTRPGMRLVGMYVPNRGNDPDKTERKKAFIDSWLRYLIDDPVSQQHHILLGDLNVVPTPQRPKLLPQQQFEYDWYEKLDRQCGLYDAALVHRTSGHESTWIAHTGEGYTYDHIMPQKTLSQRVVRFEYDHSTRSRGGVTDHSALVLTLNLDAVSYVHTRGITTPVQGKLF